MTRFKNCVYDTKLRTIQSYMIKIVMRYIYIYIIFTAIFKEDHNCDAQFCKSYIANAPSISNMLCASQIPPWLRPVLLLVSVGAGVSGAISVAFGSRDVQVQLHW